MLWAAGLCTLTPFQRPCVVDGQYRAPRCLQLHSLWWQKWKRNDFLMYMKNEWVTASFRRPRDVYCVTGLWHTTWGTRKQLRRHKTSCLFYGEPEQSWRALPSQQIGVRLLVTARVQHDLMALCFSELNKNIFGFSFIQLNKISSAL
jgi:hypothetical protein